MTPAPNALDDATATLEDSAGHWAPWFSATADRTGAHAHSGAASLHVGVTAADGWGVNLDNHPGFAAAPGPHVVGFTALAPTGAGPPVTMTVIWRDASGAALDADLLTLLPTSRWNPVGATVDAPAGTDRVSVDFSNPAGRPGDSVYLDDIGVLR